MDHQSQIQFLHFDHMKLKFLLRNDRRSILILLWIHRHKMAKNHLVFPRRQKNLEFNSQKIVPMKSDI